MTRSFRSLFYVPCGLVQRAGWAEPSTSEMDRSERFYKIDQLLKDSKVVTFARFQQTLGV